jgi:hypothetical protein
VNRTALVVVSVIAFGSGVLFALYPEIDLSIARVVHERTISRDDTVAHVLLLVAAILRKVGTWMEILFIALLCLLHRCVSSRVLQRGYHSSG